MTLRIGYVTGEYPRATDTFIQREVASLRAAGVDVRTFSIRRPASSEYLGEAQGEERRNTHYVLPASVATLARAHLRLLLARPRCYASAWALAWRTRAPGARALLWQLFYALEAGVLADAVRRLGLAHVHNHFANSSCSVTMLAAEMGGFSFSVTVHGPAIFFEPRRWRLDEKVARALFVSCISHYCRSQVMLWSAPEHWERLHVVHCGVVPDLYVPRRHEGRGRRLVFVGRLAMVKGLPVLLRAFARVRSRIPEARLELVGDGPDRAALEALARGLGVADGVVFSGYRTPEQVRDALGEADVFVMASFAEGVPVVLMEAMASGVPVVATRIAGVAELVDEAENGFLVAPGDEAALADRLLRLLLDAGLRASFGASGRAKVEREFDVGREATWLLRVLRSALEGRTEPVRAAAAGAPSAPAPRLGALPRAEAR